MNIAAVSREDAPHVLAQFAKQVKRALSSGQGDSVTAEEMLARVMDGRSYVWVAHEDGEPAGVAVLSAPEYRSGRKVFVDFLAGARLDEWVDPMESALLEARERVGAMCVEASCRPGLSRYLKRRGWKVKAVIMEAPNGER